MGKGKIKAALQLAGNEHKFQKTLILLICLSWIQINFILLGSTLIYMDPVFQCGLDDQTRYEERQACQRNDCFLVDQFTITAELSLFCDLQWARDMIQSTFSVGSFVGLIVMNIIADTKGRRISTVISLFLANIGVFCALMGGLLKIIPLLIFSQFCGGFGAYAIVTLSYTLLSDFCSQNLKPKAVVIVNSAWGFSTFTLGALYLFKIDWFSYLLYVVLLPLIIISGIMYKYITESPFILMNQNKKFEALQVLKKVAIINGIEQNIPKIQQIIQDETMRSEERKTSFKNVMKIIKQWTYFKPILILTIIYGIGNLNFFGISYSFDMQGMGFGFNSMIAGCVEMFSFLFLNFQADQQMIGTNRSQEKKLFYEFAVNVLPRKKGISGFYTLVLIIGLAFLTSWVNDNRIVGTVLLGTSRIFSTISYTLIACMQTQAFTVEIQSTALGFIEAFSLYGAFLAPLIVDLSDKIGINSITLISICVNFAIWPTYFLQETLVVDKKSKEETESLISSIITSPQIIEAYERQKIKKDFDTGSYSTLISLQDEQEKN